MIKYLELTAPEESQFRQAKIISVLVKEGEEVSAGDALFKVMSGSSEVDLPSRLSGKVIELIVEEGENISLMTPLLLLETEVEKSTASKPITDDAADALAQTPDTALEAVSGSESPQNDKPLSKDSEDEPRTENDADAVNGAKRKPNKKSKHKKASQSASDEKKGNKGNEGNEGNKEKRNKKNKKEQHQQQSLNLDGSEDAANDDERDRDDNVDSETTLESTDSRESVEIDKISTDLSNSAERTQPEMSSHMSETKIAVPDIGIDSAKVIEILVNVGDSISIDDPIVTLESDKASMDVPATADGVVSSIEISMDQDVSEGDIILSVSATGTANENESTEAGDDKPNAQESDESNQTTSNSQAADTTEQTKASPTTGSKTVDVTIPDIGGDSAKVIEIFVKQGQTVELEDPLVTLESDKASMDVPSTVSGTIESIELALDQEVSEGTLVAKISVAAEAGSAPSASPEEPSEPAADDSKPTSTTTKNTSAAVSPAGESVQPKPSADSKSHASPSVRRFARELGAELSKISGTGRKNRITKDDVKKYVKGVLSGKSAPSSSNEGSGIPAIPAVDFSKFGEIDVQPLNKIKKLTAANLHRSWLNVPHVTHNDESDISDLESFRKQLNSEYAKQGKDVKLSPLAFIVKAVVNALQTYPQFNSSLEPGGENLIYKKYFHIGIAVDTPNGLVVPVVRNADTKSVAEIAKEMGELAAKARDKKLTPADMSGTSFTISSLGGIGGTGFTPIVNAPEVAILGVSRSKMKPVWDGEEFKPGMILPLSLSYDHRVIDGAEAARFTRQIAAVLEDVRRLAV